MPRLFIFIGRSGCGKGTQAELLQQYLKKVDPARSILYIETGKLFREFITEPGYTRELTHKEIDQGNRLPDFLSIWNWSRILISKFTGQENIVLDGAPRSLLEAQMINTLCHFYSNLQPVVIFLNISRETALERMERRGRRDDQEREDVENRLNWFDRDVLPAVEYFRSNPAYKFLDINGEPSTEAIHQAIVSQI